MNKENRQYALLYGKIHRHIRKVFVKKHICSFCGEQGKSRYELALVKGKEYSFDKSDYIELCVSCHRKYDKTQIRKNVERSIKFSAEPPDPLGKRLTAYQYLKEGKNPSSKPIIQLSKSGEFIKEWSSGTEAHRILGINASGISNCIAGRTPSCGGFKWIFKINYNG